MPPSNETTERLKPSVPPRPLSASYDGAFIAELADEMIRRWDQGEQLLAEELLNRHPELWHQPEGAIELVYEEICQRKAHGQVDGSVPVLNRFPQWRQRLEVMLECHQLLEGPPREVEYPQVGETIAGYHLIQQLGQGTSGRVFLATQSQLADRPVVLKITSRQERANEHLNLARLQHTHIVPLYAVQDDPVRNLRILCMPHFGGVTLARLLQTLTDCPFVQRSGERLLKTLQASGVEPTGSAEPILRRLSYEQSLCWFGVCLADALAYAHDSGLLHLDVKPSNILIAADGLPMLLDFHLAQGPVYPGGPLPDGMGGTPDYMAPEQIEAMEALSQGIPLAVGVDQRADVFGLGVVLYEGFGGKLPFRAETSPALYRINSRVSQGLSDIVARCLTTRVEDRYANASLLATDLRCHLADRPLQGVRNRNWKERFQKWRRRRPSLIRTLSLVFVLIGAILAIAYGAYSHYKHLSDEIERTLADGRKNWREHQRFAEAIPQLKNGLELARALPLQGQKADEFVEEIRQAELAQAQDQRRRLLRELHALAEQVRAIFGVDQLPRTRLDSLNDRCQEFWGKRALLKEWVASSGSTDAANDLLDLVLFATDLQVRLATGEEKEKTRLRVLETLQEAESHFGPNIVLDEERQRHRRALKLPPLQAPFAATPRTMWEHFALGRTALLANEPLVAAKHIGRALEMEPHGFWPNFYQGHCAYRLGQYAESVAAFSVCIGAAPQVAGVYYNRALAYSAQGKLELALRDYNRALQIDPTFASAALNRGMLHFKEKRFAEAEADLRHALQLGAPAVTAYYDLAVVQAARQDIAGALQSLDEVLTRAPEQLEASKLRDHLRKKR
jgi:serine/threonine protein kinase